MDYTSFVLYQEYEQYLSFLSDEEAGQLFRALFIFSKGEKPDIKSPAVGIAYTAITNQMARDREKYEKKVQTNRENGKKGGRPPKDTSESLGQEKGAREPEKKPVYPSKTSPDNQGALDVWTEKPKETQQNPKKPKETQANPIKPLMSNELCVMNNDLKTPPLTPPWGEVGDDKPKTEKKPNLQQERFEAWWVEYPKKAGKQAARKAWNKIKPDAALYSRIIDATKAQRTSEQWRKENGQFIPDPSKWLNQGRWDDDLAALNAGGKAIGNRDFSGHVAEDYDALEE